MAKSATVLQGTEKVWDVMFTLAKFFSITVRTEGIRELRSKYLLKKRKLDKQYSLLLSLFIKTSPQFILDRKPKSFPWSKF